MNLLPIVVFTDGWRYHYDRVGLDMAQRMAIAKSGRYLVWSITWDDVERILTSDHPPDDDGSCLTDMLAAGGAIAGGQLYQRLGIVHRLNFHAQGVFHQFRSLLEGLPPVELKTISRALLLRLLAKDQPTAKVRHASILSTAPADSLAEVVQCACRSDAELVGAWLSPEGSRLAVGVSTDRSSLTKDGSPPAVVVALKKPAGVEDGEGKRRWRHLLQLANLFLPLAQTWCCATGGEFSLKNLDRSPVFDSWAHRRDDQWGTVYEYVLPSLHGLLDRLHETDSELPVVGFELLNDAQVIVAEAELAWPERLIAVVMNDAAVQPFVSREWKVFCWGTGIDPEEFQNEMLKAFSADRSSP